MLIRIETNQPQWYVGSIAPIVFSILGVIAWLVFILLYALFWSRGFSLFQNIIVTIVSLAIAGSADRLDVGDLGNQIL